mmetsp:Transcript_7880/g.31209  ORF Transcript_7880/g.31209 Transcript_7880/m.31209 type:complete len:220 (+) Transcript_7880:1587-2246(+)
MGERCRRSRLTRLSRRRRWLPRLTRIRRRRRRIRRWTIPCRWRPRRRSEGSRSSPSSSSAVRSRRPLRERRRPRCPRPSRKPPGPPAPTPAAPPRRRIARAREADRAGRFAHSARTTRRRRRSSRRRYPRVRPHLSPREPLSSCSAPRSFPCTGRRRTRPSRPTPEKASIGKCHRSPRVRRRFRPSWRGFPAQPPHPPSASARAGARPRCAPNPPGRVP